VTVGFGVTTGLGVTVGSGVTTGLGVTVGFGVTTGLGVAVTVGAGLGDFVLSSWVDALVLEVTPFFAASTHPEFKRIAIETTIRVPTWNACLDMKLPPSNSLS
jgi:hypothetical protein